MPHPVTISDEAPPGTRPARADPPPHLSWSERRDWFHTQLRQQPLAGISAEEIEVHFSGMPAHYWERVNGNDLAWGLETIHGFLNIVTMANAPGTKPFVTWGQLPHANRTRVMLCTWDRHGLLAKAAAAFSAVRLNIVQAGVFTRADNVVLDLFSVVHSDGHGVGRVTQLQEMSFLLEGALSEPPRFASVWACSRHKYLAAPPQFPPRVTFDNNSSPSSTIIHVEAADRLGLLYDILQTLADHHLAIKEASIETDNDLAHDTIHVVDAHGQKLNDTQELDGLRRGLEAAIVVTAQR